MLYEVTAPDGRRFQVQAPEGMAPEVLAREVEAAFGVQDPQNAAQPGRGGGVLPFINRGIASILGAPVDIANAVIGMDPRNLPFGVGQAAAAASIARRVSPSTMSGSRASTAPLAGFVTSNVAPESAPHQAPSI